jgi:class 3 adenylate cyclase
MATSLDIIGILIFIYFTGMNSLIMGGFLYITGVCALNIKTKQAEFSVIFSIALNIVFLILIFTNIIPYRNILGSDDLHYSAQSLIFSFVLAHVVNYFNYRTIRSLVKKNRKLMLNMLPENVLEQIEEKGAYQPVKENNVVVVFTDFVNFTSSTKNKDPEFIVICLDYYFKKFDQILTKNNLLRLKTIGDGYMFAAGLFSDNKTEVVENSFIAIKEIIEFINITKRDSSYSGLKFDIRIGMAYGEVMAAVVGNEKFSYDIWGETVNLASRLEASSLPGVVQCSETLSKCNTGKYVLDFSGTRDLKGFGLTNIYKLNLNRVAGDC